MKKTVKGIHLDLDPRIFEDIEVLELSAKTATPAPDDLSDVERARFGSQRILDIKALSMALFGDDYERVQKELRAKNDGFLTFEEWTKFVNATQKAYQKKDDARPAPSGK